MVLEQFEWNISLKEKYLSFDKEKRIRRMQFFERMLIPGVLLWIILWLPSMIAWFFINPKGTFYISLVISIIYIFIIFKYYPYIIQKRAHDFWKDWKIETYILLYWTIISTIFWLYQQYLLSNMDFITVMQISKYGTIISGILMLLWLYLLFRPGNKWNNSYWEQKYFKLKFLW